MRQPAIPKLSALSTAGRAELVTIWTTTLGEPPAALRTSRELLASALAWQLRSANLVALQPPPGASCGSWRAPTSATSAQLKCRRHRQIFAPAA